ncbi:cobalamin-dependent protein [Saccharothrix violaceirubra]|uniref:Methanogenic corrinoid protein MtbC1 n=1 Tax=Saccharothrix violaceirubra TaxID=413306 RepID=A0A7W7T4S5_9PSEU|nr:cobalamin-dependent protein [Saccharothrix violaceirubra]MBB4966012.1 methanogenic corrinoid protein MtbC1 [Saccharothrix violaceirubra]
MTTAHDIEEQLWGAVAAGDETAATDIVLTGLGGGLGAETLLLDVIGAVQFRVGAEWAANRLTVAQEHAATAINDRAVAALVGAVGRPAPHRRHVTVACLPGEWHALPARLLAEVLRLRGFRVDYLGAQVPTPHLVAHLHHTAPDVVALSGALATRLPTGHATIRACRSAGVPVVAGGSAFGVDGRHARVLGADLWALDARAAAQALEAPLPRPSPDEPDSLPHLADQEYTMVARTAGQLVKTTYTGLEQRIPGLRTADDAEREQVAEDIAHIVDFLATALYLDDTSLFADFLTWTAQVLAARGVDPAVLAPTVDILAAQLRDFPRASTLLEPGPAR